MTNNQTKNSRKVAVPAVYVWAAGQKFKASNQIENLKLVISIFRNSIGDPYKKSYSGQGDREKNFNQLIGKI